MLWFEYKSTQEMANLRVYEPPTCSNIDSRASPCKSDGRLEEGLPLSIEQQGDDVANASQHGCSLESSWFLMHRRYASDRVLLAVFLAKSVPELLVMAHPLFTYAGRHETLGPEPDCPSLENVNWCLAAILVYNAIVLLYAAMKSGAL